MSSTRSSTSRSTAPRACTRCPSAFGVRVTFAVSRALHVATVGFLVLAGIGLAVGPWYWAGVGAVAALLLYEHLLVSPGDLRRLDLAFFTMNGVISLTLFAFVLADVVA